MRRQSSHIIKNIYDNENFEKDILKFKKEIREKYSESDKLYLLMNLAKVKEELDMIKSIKLMRFPHIEKLKRKGNYNESDI